MELVEQFLTKLVDICGNMWRVITRANLSHIVGKLVTVRQGLLERHFAVKKVVSNSGDTTFDFHCL